MKKKGWLVGCLLLIVLCAISSLFIYNKYFKMEVLDLTEKSRDFEHVAPKIIKSQIVNNQIMAIVYTGESNFHVVDKHYITTFNAEGKEISLKNYSGIERRDTTQANLSVYELGNERLLHQIDLLPILKKYDYQLLDKKDFDKFSEQPAYISLKVEKRPQNLTIEDTGLNHVLYVELASGKVFWRINKTVQPQKQQGESFNHDIDLLTATTLLIINKIDVKISGLSDYVLIECDSNKLPKENKKLYTAFPWLKKYQTKKNKKLQLRFYQSMTNQEVLSYLLEDNQTLTYDNVVISEDYTFDGDSHEVGNPAEFDYWYKYSKQNEEKGADKKNDEQDR